MTAAHDRFADPRAGAHPPPHVPPAHPHHRGPPLRHGLLARIVPALQELALVGVPDLPLSLLHRLSHAAFVAQGAEFWTGTHGGHRVQRYAFAGRGRGPATLLLHGLGGFASSLSTILPAVRAAARRVELIELPGMGRSPVPAGGGLSVREHGDVVLAILEQLAAEHGRIALVGHSLGGALALGLAHERPALVAGVAGLNPAGGDLSVERVLELVASLSPGVPGSRQGAANIARLLFHRTPPPFWLFARDLARVWGERPVQRILADAARGDGLRSITPAELAAIAAPVLILWGARDRILPASSVDHFRAHLRRGEVHLLDGSGHSPQLEAPFAVARKLRAFLRGL